jgi:RNA 2',3'-cyclic 3'-phosphodiesterase
MTTIRAFFALGLSGIRSPLSAFCEQLKNGLPLPASTEGRHPLLRWVPPENYHITLAFLGDIDSSAISKLKNLSEPLSMQISPIPLQLNNSVWFPNVNKPKVLAVVPESADQLMTLQAKLFTQLKLSGYVESNHQYKPHVTLARVNRISLSSKKNRQSGCERVANINACVDEFVLYSSTSGPNAPIYTPLFTQKLTGRG